MAKTKRTKDSKERLINFKQKQKQMTKEQNQIPQAPQMPEVREQPYWGSNDDMSMKGIEFETLYNGISQMVEIAQGLFGAGQSVMQRNLLEGKVRVRFEKLVDVTFEDGTPGKDYAPMSEEEQAPHIETYNKMVEQFRETRAKAMEQAEAAKVQEAPRLDGIVDASGSPIGEGTNAIVDALGQPMSSN